jgi:DNA (cytosine-5)-methyltransferase 1
MRYLSVCSGIEAATVAWHPLGWTPVAFSEIEPFPCAVLAHHYPDVPNLGDMTKYKEWNLERGSIDLLVGGTPCQSFSVAGLRAGLDDPRGNLMLVYLDIARRFAPAWVVWENVPGVLSSNGGRDFGTFLGGMAECGYGFAYRVLDAQFFGVPQRRRRVFIVGHFGGWRRAAAVLFERESLRGYPPPSRESGERIAPTVSQGPPFSRTGNQRIEADALVMAHGQGGEEIVRRITPRECERLQRFPDDYTAITHRGKSAADGPRYKALGNSMATACMSWLGRRIDAVGRIAREGTCTA